jgi:hypothetical protein
MTLSKEKDPMGKAIADFWRNGKAGRLRVFSPMFEEDEIPVSYLFRTVGEMSAMEQEALRMAQGKTLDRVIIDIDRGAFAHGQLYVALSRTRKKSDMYIKRTITEDDIIFSKRIKSFLE